MSIEHINPQSTSEADINIYENCIYCCRRCNRSRSDQPRESAGRTLLEPTNASWADHFRAVGDNLIPLTDDARHTSEIYDINSPDKVARRRKRRETIEDHLTLLKQAPSRESRFLALAANVVESDPKLYAVLMDAAQKLRQQMIRARIDLARYSAIPVDASDTCRCRPKIELRLPESLEAQLIDISGFGSVVVTS